jgi:hypothetical protein
VDDAGKIVREAKVASELEALLQVLRNTIYRFKRVGLICSAGVCRVHSITSSARASRLRLRVGDQLEFLLGGTADRRASERFNP